MRRTMALMILAVVGLTATPAGAAGRTPFEPIPPGGFEFPAGSLCSFGLKVEPVVSREYMKTLPDGSVLITGALFIRLTNTDTDESRVVNISGPSRISADGTTEHRARAAHAAILRGHPRTDPVPRPALSCTSHPTGAQRW